MFLFVKRSTMARIHLNRTPRYGHIRKRCFDRNVNSLGKNAIAAIFQSFYFVTSTALAMRTSRLHQNECMPIAGAIWAKSDAEFVVFQILIIKFGIESRSCILHLVRSLPSSIRAIVATSSSSQSTIARRILRNVIGTNHQSAVARVYII